MNRLPSFKLLCSVLAGLAGSLAFGETLYWSPTVKSGSNYNWTEPKNWKDGSGAAVSACPQAGDTAVLGDTTKSSGTSTYLPNGETCKLYEIRIGPGKVVTMSQGNYGLQAGGRGFQMLASSGAIGNWGGMWFSGDGDVPINISNNVQFAMQMRMKINGTGTPAIVKEGRGEFICFNQGSNEFGLREVRVKQGAIDCSMDNATISNCRFMFDGNDGSARFTMGFANHKGLNLKNCGLYETNGVANTAHGFGDRGKGYQVSFTGTQKLNPTVFTGQFYETAGLNWNPSSASEIFICSNGVSATTGTVTVAKGTVRLANGASFTALADLQVSAGATFEVADAPTAAFHSEKLTLADATAKVKLAAGVGIAAATAALSGKALKPGVYAKDPTGGQLAAAWIDGAGTVTVETGPSGDDVWTGGAAGGTSALLGGNWASGEDPSLSDGTFFATFASGGSEASLPAGTTAKFNGIVLKNTSGNAAFAFPAGAGATATVGENGLKGQSETATTWNMAWPLALGAVQSWTLGANDTLVVAGGLSGTEALTLDGAGAVTFASPSTHSGALTLNGGTVRVTATNGLGTADREVMSFCDKAKLSFGGDIAIDSPLYSKTSGSDNNTIGMTVEPNANVVFNGKVRQYSQAGRLTVGAGATVTLRGGYQQVTSGMSSTFHPRGSGTIVVENNPIICGFQLLCASDNPVALDFRTTGNNFKQARDYNWSLFTGPVYTRVANVFAARQWIQLRGPDAVFDLCGTDQSVMLFHGETGTRVTSATPATLTVTSQAMSEYNDTTGAGGTNRVDLAAFGGLVSFRKTGPTIHTFGATSASSGTVTVAEGPLVFNANGKWPNASEVRVEGGMLTLGNAEALGSNTIWRVTTGSAPRVEIAGAGQTNFCERLYVDGRRQVGGLYGASGSGAPKEAAWLAGAGVLQVAEHGLMIFLR